MISTRDIHTYDWATLFEEIHSMITGVKTPGERANSIFVSTQPVFQNS